MIVAVDFDDTIYDWSTRGVIPGAKEGLKKLKEMGFVINIHSCRTSCEFKRYPIDRNQEVYFMEAFLNENDIPFDRVLNVDKPMANYYLDDKGREINNNWESVVSNIISDIKNEKTINEFVFELAAVIDGGGESKNVNLYLEYDGDIYQEIRWPDDWPEKVSNSFLREKGFKVRIA